MVQQWADEKTRFELRVVLLVTTMIYGEMGVGRMRVLRLHDGPSPYCNGLAADISVLELPGVKRAAAAFLGLKCHARLPMRATGTCPERGLR